MAAENCIEVAGDNGMAKRTMANAGEKWQGMLHSGKKGDRSNKKATSKKEKKTSRAERGYIEEQAPKRKDDWKQFFNSDNNKKKEIQEIRNPT